MVSLLCSCTYIVVSNPVIHTHGPRTMSNWDCKEHEGDHPIMVRITEDHQDRYVHKRGFGGSSAIPSHAHPLTRTHAHTHTLTHARAHKHAHKHAHTRRKSLESFFSLTRRRTSSIGERDGSDAELFTITIALENSLYIHTYTCCSSMVVGARRR